MELSASNAGRDGSPSRPKRGCIGVSTLLKRKWLRHGIPSWVENGVFFITIKVKSHSNCSLTHEAAFNELRDGAVFYHGRRWWIHLLLCMPDHVHALLSFPVQEPMNRVVADWKRYMARRLGIVWQGGFFDHRLRCDESYEEKAHYIRMNPVRAGLANNPEDWPFVITTAYLDVDKNGSPSRPKSGCLGEASLPNLKQ
jgi:putative transposase